VLSHVDLDKIHKACDELQIFCSTCTPIQLAALKLAKILPVSAPQCGLITKSDAERLCSLLLQEEISLAPPRSTTPRSPLSSPPPPPTSPAVSPPRGDPTQFKVQHKCFGSCVGVLHPQSYSSPGAKCIECSECPAFLSPQRFVCHTHQTPETRTCHWGFDSANWAAYIQVCEDYTEEEREKFNEELSSIKKRFSQNNKVKRKWMEQDQRDEAKRSRQNEPDPLESPYMRGGPLHGQIPGPGFPFPGQIPPHFPGQPLDHQPTPHGVFMNPLRLPLPFPDKAGFPGPLDPRYALYLQWLSTGQVPTPGFPPGMQQQPPGAPGYLQSLAQIHNLKALAAKTFMEQQNLAKTILQASLSNNQVNYECLSRKARMEESGRQDSKKESQLPWQPQSKQDLIPLKEDSPLHQEPASAPQISEFVVSVSAVLETTGVDTASRASVMAVVNRLVDRLNRVEEEKNSATQQLKGMEEKVNRLEKELEDRRIIEKDDEDKTGPYESSSDLGIESGTEVDGDSLSEK